MEKIIESLNKELPQFFLEELEQRLETDPLSVGGLFDLQAAEGDEGCFIVVSCGEKGNCTDVSGGVITW